jgi:biopolymer transport protein ExbB/TolQ
MKLGPMFGLLGTLIPLGPGIIALGRGDTYTLSSSLLTAFDTTIAGLIAAAVATVISTIRKRWYSRYVGLMEAVMECLLEAMEHEAS